MVAQAVAAIALGLLGMAGVAKVVDPDPTSGALEAAQLPSGRPLARALGAVEILAALFGLTPGGGIVAVAAVLYLGFTLFTLSGVLEQATHKHLPSNQSMATSVESHGFSK